MDTQPFARMFENALPAAFPPLMTAPVARALGIHEADALCRSATDDTGQLSAAAVLNRLQVTCAAGQQDIDQIPKTGAAVVVSNHPHGLLDAALLASVLLAVREDVKFLANPLVSGIAGIRHLVIPIDPFGEPGSRHGNSRGLRAALEFLGGGGLLVVFPAGEVSHFDWQTKAVTDPAWHEAVARLLRLAQRRTPALRVIPARIEGRNGMTFQLAGMIHPRLRTALLVRELLAQKGQQRAIRLATASRAGAILEGRTDQEAIAYLRWRSELLGRRPAYRTRTNWPLRRKRSGTEPIRPPVDPALLREEIARLTPESLLGEAGGLQAFAMQAEEAPHVLTEIARLREVTFRLAGEGTGRREDRDSFDAHYTHLFLWNPATAEVAGAYRICSTDVGKAGLYTATLFRYDDAFLRRLGPAMELGRSFVRPEYQKGFSPLLLLWKAIGKLVSRDPRHRVLFGPVSISGEYHPASRQIMAAFLKRFAWLNELSSLVASRHPFVPDLHSLAMDVEELSAAICDIEQKPSGVPVLLRQYLKLGGKLLGFSVDPEFANVVDGLIVVDLRQTEEKLLERYLGKDEAAAFLRYQG